MKKEINKGKVIRILSEMLTLMENDDFYVEDLKKHMMKGNNKE